MSLVSKILMEADGSYNIINQYVTHYRHAVKVGDAAKAQQMKQGLENYFRRINKDWRTNPHAAEILGEVSTPTVTNIEPLTHDYFSPEEKEQKQKKAEREKGYREEGRYDGLY
jgi:ribosomal protein S17E